jgi:hypothetical protein
MAFDSVFNGDPTASNVNASGSATFGIDISTGKLYFRDLTSGGWLSCGGGAPGGASGAIQFNNGGNFAGSAAKVNPAGTITIPDGQQIVDTEGSSIQFATSTAGSGGIAFVDVAGDSIVLDGGNVSVTNAAGDGVDVNAGSITVSTSGGGPALRLLGGLFTEITDPSAVIIVIGGTAIYQITAGSFASPVPISAGPYTVATLPVGAEGQMAYATDGRKVGEGVGAGTGVPVYFSNTHWRVFSTDAQVQA